MIRRLKCMVTNARLVGLMLILTGMCAAAPSGAEEKRACTETLAAFLKSSTIEAGGKKIRASACAYLPGAESTVLLAFAVEPAGYSQSTDYQLTRQIFTVSADSLRVVSSHEGSIDEDAANRVREDSLRFDLAPYVLATGVRAFGLRISAFLEPKFSDGGSDDYLTLYVIEGRRIRPVLSDLSMRTWRNSEAAEDRDDPCKTRTTTYVLGVAKTVSNGFADLLISARTSCRRKVLTHRLRYDGTSYPFELMDLRIKLSGSK